MKTLSESKPDSRPSASSVQAANARDIRKAFERARDLAAEGANPLFALGRQLVERPAGS